MYICKYKLPSPIGRSGGLSDLEEYLSSYTKSPSIMAPLSSPAGSVVSSNPLKRSYKETMPTMTRPLGLKCVL